METESKIKKLSPIELKLYSIIKEIKRPLTLEELEKLNPKYLGALGKLNQLGLITIKKIPHIKKKIVSRRNT